MATTKQTKTADKVSTNLSSDAEISSITAKKDAAEYNYQNASYKPSDETKAYKKALDGLGDYDSPYSEPINNILSNMQKGYDMNNDPTFKQYQDIYTRNAQEASRDVVARQAALNGGAASSMAQRQAGQAYNNTMQGLYDLVPQLSQQWMNNQQALLSAYQNQDQLDYTKFTDNRTFYQNMYLASQERDVDLYNTELQKMYNTIAMYQKDIDTAMSWKEFAAEYNRLVEQDGISNAIAWAQQELQEAQFKEQQRQYNANLAEDRRQFDAQLAEDKRVANMNDANTKAQRAQDQRQHNDNMNLTLTELATRTAEAKAKEAEINAEKEATMGQLQTELMQYYSTVYKDAGKSGFSGEAVLKTMKKKIQGWADDGLIDTKQAGELTTYAADLINE